MNKIERIEEQIEELADRVDSLEENSASTESIEEVKAIRIQDKNYELEFTRFEERIRRLEIILQLEG